jgi:hypothetical protein
MRDAVHESLADVADERVEGLPVRGAVEAI